MRLAFYTYSYTDRQNLAVDECLKRVARTGYSGIDESATFGASESPRSVTPQRRKQIRAAAEQNQLSVEAVVTHAELTTSLTSLTGTTPLDLKGSVDLAADLGAKLVTFHMGGLPKGLRANEADALWRKVSTRLRDAANYGAAKHVALAVDGIWPTWIVDTPDALQRLFDDVDHPNLGVNLDPSYLSLFDVDPVKFVRRFRDRILHAHLKDHVGKYPTWDPAPARCTIRRCSPHWQPPAFRDHWRSSAS